MWEDFERVVRARRSVRRFTPQPVAEADMRHILEAGTLAPSSSNLQPYTLYWVRSEAAKRQLVRACLSQSAARKASELVVCIARWDEWDDTRREYLAFLQTQQGVPRGVMTYYRSLSRGLYALGPLDITGQARRLGATVTGAFRPVPRAPFDREDMRVWAVKSAALCCENMMLAAAAKQLDSCPMEGHDPLRVGEVVGLARKSWKRSWDVAMVLAFGHRDPNGGVWGAQWRRDRDRLVREV